MADVELGWFRNSWDVVVLEKEEDFLPMNIEKWAANQDVVGIIWAVAIISTIRIFFRIYPMKESIQVVVAGSESVKCN